MMSVSERLQTASCVCWNPSVALVLMLESTGRSTRRSRSEERHGPGDLRETGGSESSGTGGRVDLLKSELHPAHSVIDVARQTCESQLRTPKEGVSSENERKDDVKTCIVPLVSCHFSVRYLHSLSHVSASSCRSLSVSVDLPISVF